MTSLWQRFREQKPWTRILEVQALVLMLIGGLLFIGGKISLDQTNTLAFCTSCHEMRDNNFEEYSHTIHARNRTGVKATCSDCHVPHEFGGHHDPQGDGRQRRVPALRRTHRHPREVRGTPA